MGKKKAEMRPRITLRGTAEGELLFSLNAFSCVEFEDGALSPTIILTPEQAMELANQLADWATGAQE